MSATADFRISADTSQSVAEVRHLRAEVETLKRELSEGRSPRVSILREPLTYEARLVRDQSEETGFRAVSDRQNRSYVRDFVLAQTDGDSGAKERLERHAREMKTIGEERNRVFHPDVAYEFEQRAVNWTSGTGGYFAPPLWIIEQFAVVPTPERVLSRLAPQFELPEGAQSVNLPRWTAGGDVGVAQVASPVASTDVVDSVVSSAVATIAGNLDVPMQMLEQSPQGAHFDWVTFTNMEARYGYRLELQLLTGNGSNVETTRTGNNELLGILKNTAIPSGNIVANTQTTVATWFSASAGAGGGPLAQVVAQIGNNRKLPPEYWMMTTSRGAWIASGEVSMFPLAVSNQTGPGKFDILAYPVELNDVIPINVNGNQDVVIACRPSDWLILESERRTSVYTDVLGGTLQARLQMRRYVAALLRQPTSVAYVTGVGNVIPAGM